MKTKKTTNKNKASKLAKSNSKNNCAVTLGRAGGKATKAAKKGIFSAAYKAKRKKAAPKKKAAAKRKRK